MINILLYLKTKMNDKALAQQSYIRLPSQLLFNQPLLEVFVSRNTRNAFNLLNNYVNKSTLRYFDNQGTIE